MQHVLIIDIILFVIHAQFKEVLPACEPYLVFVREEELCLNKMQLNITSEAEDCIGMWDHVNCWPDASVGETVSQPCPSFFKSAVKGEAIPLGMFTGNVYRNCTDQGWTDPYSPQEEACDYSFNDTLHFFEESTDTYRYFLYVKTVYTIGYSLSLISLTIAIIILCLFRKLHCTRNYIHIQLFFSFILRAAFIFIRDAQLFTNEDLYHCDYYPVACKAVLMLSNYCILANYSWLLVEGHYLYTLVNFSLFSKSQHLCCYTVLGWGLPMVVISSWGLAKYFYEDMGCWETRGHDWIWWILKVPVLLFIVTNVFFFLSIIRVLVGKLKMSDVHGNEINQCKRLIKSTFFLVALFGLQYVLFVFVPVRVSNAMFKIWNFAELTLASTQGFVVAVLYCFLNGEVQFEIQRRWRRWRLRRHLHGESRQSHGSISQSGSASTQVSLLACGPTQVV